MSEIDGVQHSCIGFLFGIPVYHPIEDQDSSINSNSLIIGGGSGEHSMFAITNLEGCLQEYLFFHGGDYPDTHCDWEMNWSIEECYNIFPKIKPIMEKYNVKSAEKMVSLAIGDFLRLHGGHFVSNWRHIKPATLNMAMNLQSDPMDILEVKSDTGGLGKWIQKGKTIWGFSFAEEITNFNEIRIQAESEAIIKNTNMNIIMKTESGQ